MLSDFFNKTNLRVICLFTAHAVDSEWTHMWPATSVNNDDGTDYLRLSHLTALSAGVNNYLRCIHKGLTAFSQVTPPIRVHDQTILTQSFDPMDYASGIWLPAILNIWYDNTKKAMSCLWRLWQWFGKNKYDLSFLCPGLSGVQMAKYDWNMFRNYVAFLAGGTRRPHHGSEFTACYHEAFQHEVTIITTSCYFTTILL